jgi:hypothetical protein
VSTVTSPDPDDAPLTDQGEEAVDHQGDHMHRQDGQGENR